MSNEMQIRPTNRPVHFKTLMKIERHGEYIGRTRKLTPVFNFGFKDMDIGNISLLPIHKFQPKNSNTCAADIIN